MKIKLTGLWLNEDKDGNKYMAGNVNSNMKVLIYKNSYKKDGSNDPDYVAYLVPIESKDKKVNQPKEDEEAPF